MPRCRRPSRRASSTVRAAGSGSLISLKVWVRRVSRYAPIVSRVLGCAHTPTALAVSHHPGRRRLPRHALHRVEGQWRTPSVAGRPWARVLSGVATEPNTLNCAPTLTRSGTEAGRGTPTTQPAEGVQACVRDGSIRRRRRREVRHGRLASMRCSLGPPSVAVYSWRRTSRTRCYPHSRWLASSLSCPSPPVLTCTS